LQQQDNIPSGTIIWIAPFYNRSGYGVGARATVLSLHRAGLNIRIMPVNEEETGINDFDIQFLKSLESTPLTPPFTVVIFHVPDEAWLKFKLPEPCVRIIATTFDSSAQGNLPPAEWLAVCKRIDQVWLHSELEKNAFVTAGLPAKKIELVRWPHHWLNNPAIPKTIPEPSLNEKPFRFLSIAMFQPRRRWDTLIESFLAEFKGNQKVELYLKVNYPPWHPVPDKPRQDLQTLVKSLRQKTGSDISIIVDEALGTRIDIVNLMDSCHAYISTDTATTAPISEARTRKRMVIVPIGLGLSMPPDQQINVIPNYKRTLTDEMLLYQPHHSDTNTLMPQLRVTDVRHAMRCVYDMSPEERYTNSLKSASVVPDIDQTVPEAINAIKKAWATKLSQNNLNSLIIPEIDDNKINLTWEGSFFVHHSLALVNREIVNSLLEFDNDIALSLTPYEKDQFKPESEHYLNRLVPLINQDIGKADIHVRHHWPPNLEAPESGHWVIIQPWEFGSLPKEWVKTFQEEVDECWCYSNYVKKVYIEGGVNPDKVFTIPLGINPSIFHPQVLPTPIETKKKFKFLFVGGTIHRKGIDILLKSYLRTFSSKDDVSLVIKDFGGDSFYQGRTIAEYIASVRSDRRAPEIIYIDRTLPDMELAGLYTACNVLVHPYRGEGFGLPILESMACGTPVIITNGGAALDFCKPSCSLLVNAKKVFYGHNYVGERELVDKPWFFEPEPADLAAKMLNAYEKPEKLREWGWRAHQEAHQNWTWVDTGKKIVKRINMLKEKPIRRELRRESQRQNVAEPGSAPNQKNDASDIGSNNEIEKLKAALQEKPGNITLLEKLTELHINNKIEGIYGRNEEISY